MLFQKLHSRDEYEGAGLGLALCKKITDNHSGYIEAEGEEGQGALIRIFLPI
ncbi:ATP-binding protein [Arcticibacter sp. MXS-1]|uniref:ATP-binding protein n=1 Tax=Arcticibacter sp. MXS-1 TaxID=3341726 RepID=UPI0035A91503